MILPIILAMLAATFFATTNHIDTFLISKAVKNTDYRALVLVSTIIAGAVMSLIYMIVCEFNLAFDLPTILLLIANASITTVSLIMYFKALARDDTTIVIIMFQLIPVFILLISPLILQGQHINPLQLVGGLLITLAAFFVTYEPAHKKFDKKRLVTLGMMTISSLAYAIWFVVERYVNQTHDFNQTIFWTNVSSVVVGVIIFLLVKKYRKSFLLSLKSNGPKVIGLDLLNELFSSFGNVLLTFAGTMAPVALASFVSQGTQPFAVMLLGLLFVKLFPSINRNKISKVEVIKRVITIAICIIGLGFIEFG